MPQPSTYRIDVPFNHQQLDLLDTFIKQGKEAPDLPSLILKALESAKPTDDARPSGNPPPLPEREVLASYLIEPGKGRAIPVKKGQVLRIEQVEGGQCGDFNVFNMHNRLERLHAGLTFIMHGESPGVGTILWSNAPWERPLMAVLDSTTQTDTLYSGCSALLYSHFFGARNHTNCREIITEAVREYGLKATDTHDSFNLFMYVDFDKNGKSYVVRNKSRKGDYIEFLAMMDVLAVSNVCGDDLGKSSNFWLRPLKATVMSPLEKDRKRMGEIEQEVEKFVLPPRSEIEPEPITKMENYTPAFPHLPIRVENVAVVLDEPAQKKFEQVRNRSLYGDDDGAAMRDIMMSWVGERMDW